MIQVIIGCFLYWLIGFIASLTVLKDFGIKKYYRLILSLFSWVTLGCWFIWFLIVIVWDNLNEK